MSDKDTNDVHKTVAGQRGWRDDPLSTFLLVGAAVLALMYVLETRQRAGLDAQEAQASAIAVRAGFVEPDCMIGAAGARGEILVVACEQESLQHLISGVSTGLSNASEATGFERVYLVGQDDAGHSAHRMCELTGDSTVNLETCRGLDRRQHPKDSAQVVVGAVGVK